MAKDWAKPFYNSKKWKKKKESYKSDRMMIDGGKCEECHVEEGYIVHHTITLTEENIKDPDIALNDRYLKFVCKNCHDKYEGHGVGKKVEPLFMFDEDGQPISLREIDNPPVKKVGG